MDLSGVRVEVLGPVRLLVDGAPVPLEPRLRTVLALAAMSHELTVTFESLRRRLGDPAEATIRGYAKELRRRSGREIVRKNQIKVISLALAKAQVDYWRFHELVARARGLEPGAKAPLLREAKGLWRSGEPLSDLPGDLVGSEIGELTWRYRGLLLDLFDAELAADELEAAVAVAEQAASAFGDDNEVRQRLWQAWERTGRSREIRDDLARRVETAAASGIDLPEAVWAQARIAIAEAGRVKPMSSSPPNWLPPRTVEPRGRDREFDDLDALTDERSGVRVAVITGLGGAGKTVLAVNWGHGNAEHFPDGVLYVVARSYPGRPGADLDGQGVRAAGGAKITHAHPDQPTARGDTTGSCRHCSPLSFPA
ncbi:AfsR/SARP family transcriptional regulator [Actinokineospora inagensis]|uniref:AfsR/SARP family transcriptional regulator n=1 Tax=Actinokineospora inagensis TaxID=103730 RepID=UPI0012FC2F96|nr:BTAD domain-containing putative transcriptional regulator [Actinokineospora inagensis]